MDKIEQKEDAMPLGMENKSNESKKNKGEGGHLEADSDLPKENEIKSVLNKDGDEALHKKDNMGGNGDLQKNKKKRKRDSTKKAQIDEKEQGPVDAPDCNPESRKEKKHVISAIESSKDEKVGFDENCEDKKKKKTKKVSFSGQVEVFPSSNTDKKKQKIQESNLVRGKRFTLEEDKIIKEAVFNYIKTYNLGEKGLARILNCNAYPELKNCWKEIGTCIPYRPHVSVYSRAHILFERAENRKWTAEEIERLKESYEKHGNNWKLIAEKLGRNRIHVKDKWRQFRPLNRKSGRWCQEEYESFYELVNSHLQTKVSQEKKSKHGMLRDNIPWTAISEKLSTRNDSTCCEKWYHQLTSSLVEEDKWSNADDYRLIRALYDLDASCLEDVDWDALLAHRPGDVCRKRWDQMVHHIGHHGSQPFTEQVETLATRYCPDLAETVETWDNKPVGG